jgi:hypothetical protein
VFVFMPLQEPEEAVDAGPKYFICRGCWNGVQHGDQPEAGLRTNKTPREGDKRAEKAQRMIKLLTKDKVQRWEEFASKPLHQTKHCMRYAEKLASGFRGRVEIPYCHDRFAY